MNYSLKYYLLLAVAVAVLISITSVYALTGGDFNQTDFDSGTYTNTLYNSTSNAVQLNASTTGNFTSQIFNAGDTASWDTLSWVPGAPYQQELPDNQGVETVMGGADMTGNILLFHMNELGEAVIDYSGDNNSVSYYNVNNISSGKFNEAYDFNGDSFVNLTLNITGFGSISIGLWFKVDSIDEDDRLVSLLYATKEEVKIYLTSTEIKGRFDDDSSKELSANLTDTSIWHNVFIVNNGSDSLLYYDGEFKHSRSETFDFANADGLTYIGSKAGNFNNVRNGFDGKMDEFAIWNRSLSTGEVMNIYKRGLSLDLSARSCDGTNCSGESFVDIEDTSPQNLTLNNNTHFQYKFDFVTGNENISPVMYNLTVDYTAASQQNESQNTTETITQTRRGNSCKKDIDMNLLLDLELEPELSEFNVTVKNIGSCVLYDINVSLEVPQGWGATAETVDELGKKEEKLVSLAITPLDSAEGEFILKATAETAGAAKTKEILTFVSKPEITAPPIVKQIFEEPESPVVEEPGVSLPLSTEITGYTIAEFREDVFENRNTIYLYLIAGLITLLFIIELRREFY